MGARTGRYAGCVHVGQQCLTAKMAGCTGSARLQGRAEHLHAAVDLLQPGYPAWRLSAWLRMACMLSANAGSRQAWLDT